MFVKPSGLSYGEVVLKKNFIQLSPLSNYIRIVYNILGFENIIACYKYFNPFNYLWNLIDTVQEHTTRI